MFLNSNGSKITCLRRENLRGRVSGFEDPKKGLIKSVGPHGALGFTLFTYMSDCTKYFMTDFPFFF